MSFLNVWSDYLKLHYSKLKKIKRFFLSGGLYRCILHKLIVFFVLFSLSVLKILIFENNLLNNLSKFSINCIIESFKLWDALNSFGWILKNGKLSLWKELTSSQHKNIKY